MEHFVLDNILARLRAALERDDLADAAAIIAGLRPSDQADLFAELGDEVQVALLPELHPADSADILEKLDDETAAELIAALPSEAVIRIVDQMHPDDSAGGLMTSEFLALRRRMTAADAIRAVHDWKPEAEEIYFLFVVDGTGRLCGVVSLRQLIVTEPDTPLQAIMDPEVISVQAGTDQEECARIMTRYDLLALPVVDGDGKLLGVVTVDDVVDVLVDEATEDIQRLGGAQPLERPYLDTGILTMVRKRIGWLLLLFVTETLTGSVLRHFEGELQAVVALSFFVPLLIGTGGNAGSQTTSTIIRALAVGEIDLGDALYTLWHELRTGLLLGVAMAMAAIAYGRALTWGSSQALAITVSLAILAIVVWANGLGSVLPLLAARLRIDPAVVSGPVMSTLVDATGLFIYFTIARVILGL